MVRSLLSALGLAFCLWPGLTAPLWADARVPARVVSMNLCTDQLAMLVGAPGQVVSVSHIARDIRSSPMAVQAREFPINFGTAEEIFALRPDLVLAGPYSDTASIAMLRRLGIRVDILPMADDMDGIRSGIAHIGNVLGQDARAREIIAQFDEDLAALRAHDLQVDRVPSAALYYANSFTAGRGTLADQILTLAGLDNIAPHGGQLPLEMLVMSQPDILIRSEVYPGASRAEAVLDHPVLHAFDPPAGNAALSNADWACGTPFVMRAAARLRDAVSAPASMDWP